MKHFIRAIAAVALALGVGVASAQKAPDTSRAAPAAAFVNYCMNHGDISRSPNPAAECACGAGVLSGHMNDRQYQIMGRLTPFTGNQTAMVGEVRTMVGEGYSGDEIRDVGQMMTGLADEVSATCTGIAASP